MSKLAAKPCVAPETVEAAYAVLQKLPPEALDDAEQRYGAVDVLMVGIQPDAEAFLADYRRRHQAACREWEAWDVDESREWDSAFDRKHDELCVRYAVSTLIDDVAFEIAPVGDAPEV